MALLDVEFDRFWASFPKRRAKKDAYKAWVQLNPSEQLIGRILEALRWQSRSDDWLRDSGRWIPLPATYLRGARWEDEPTEVPRVSERTIATARAVQEFLND